MNHPVKQVTPEALARAPTVAEVAAAAAAGMLGRRPEEFGVTTQEAAIALGVSVTFLKQDRNGPKTIPHFYLGKRCRYDLARVREALARTEVGGQVAEKVAA